MNANKAETSTENTNKVNINKADTSKMNTVAMVNMVMWAMVNMVTGAGATTIRITIGGMASITPTVTGRWIHILTNGYGLVNQLV